MHSAHDVFPYLGPLACKVVRDPYIRHRFPAKVGRTGAVTYLVPGMIYR